MNNQKNFLHMVTLLDVFYNCPSENTLSWHWKSLDKAIKAYDVKEIKNYLRNRLDREFLEHLRDKNKNPNKDFQQNVDTAIAHLRSDECNLKNDDVLRALVKHKITALKTKLQNDYKQSFKNKELDEKQINELNKGEYHEDEAQMNVQHIQKQLEDHAPVNEDNRFTETMRFNAKLETELENFYYFHNKTCDYLITSIKKHLDEIKTLCKKDNSLYKAFNLYIKIPNKISDLQNHARDLLKNLCDLEDTLTKDIQSKALDANQKPAQKEMSDSQRNQIKSRKNKSNATKDNYLPLVNKNSEVLSKDQAKRPRIKPSDNQLKNNARPEKTRQNPINFS